MISVSVTLSDWIYRAVMAKSVLTLHRDYLRLRKPLERRLYEIARKHCGGQTECRISLELLLKKCGSNSPKRVFKQMIKVLIEHDQLPEYTVSLDGDLVVLRNRDRLIEREGVVLPKLDPDMMNDVLIVAPGLGPYALEAAWHEMWVETGCPKLSDTNATFLAFCQRRAELAGKTEASGALPPAWPQDQHQKGKRAKGKLDRARDQAGHNPA